MGFTKRLGTALSTLKAKFPAGPPSSAGDRNAVPAINLPVFSRTPLALHPITGIIPTLMTQQRARDASAALGNNFNWRE